MGRPTNADIVARLDALVAEVASLRDEVAGLRAALAGRGARREAPAGRGLDGQAVPGAPAVAEEVELPPIVLDVDPATPAELLGELFAAATDEDDERGFERFVLLMHPRALDGPRARSSLRAFQWKQLRRNVREYLEDPARLDSFHITDQRPQDLGPRELTCKVFVASSRRMPVPLLLRRLEDDPTRWRIEVCSL